MAETFWAALAASTTAAAVTTTGILVIRRFEAWGRRNSTYFVCFAAGVLITVSFLHIVPKSFSFPDISRIDASLLGALLSFSAGALVYVGTTHLLPQAEEEPRRYNLAAFAAGIAVALGIIFSKG